MRRWLTLAGLMLAVLFQVAQPGRTLAVVPVEFFRDTINDTTPGRPNVAHDIYFVLPANAQQITPTDHILLDFHFFQNTTVPTSVSGGFGNATFSKSGNVIDITNVALLPGTGMTIYGIYAQNPNNSQGFQVTLMISGDSAGTQIRNQSTTVANPSGNQLSVTATVESQLSAINISGYTSPGSFVTMSEGTSVVGTTVANGTGYFAFPIGGLSPGNHLYSVFSTDGAGLSTSRSSLQLYLLPGTLTAASGILLSPSLKTNKTSIQPGETLTVLGSAKPNSQINIFIESPLRSYQATTNTNGDYSFLINSAETTTYNPGQYRATAIVQDSIGNQSIVSPTTTFDVTSPGSGTNNPAPACDISKGDLNCDTDTDIVDFSILIFHWNTDHRVADINADGGVNLVDFSIMMFYF